MMSIIGAATYALIGFAGFVLMIIAFFAIRQSCRKAY